MNIKPFFTIAAIALLAATQIPANGQARDKHRPATTAAPAHTIGGTFEFYTLFVADRDPVTGKWSVPVYGVTLFRYDPAAKMLTICTGRGCQDPWPVFRFSDDGKTTVIETDEDTWTVTGAGGKMRVGRNSKIGRMTDATYTNAAEQ